MVAKFYITSAQTSTKQRSRWGQEKHTWQAPNTRNKMPLLQDKMTFELSTAIHFSNIWWCHMYIKWYIFNIIFPTSKARQKKYNLFIAIDMTKHKLYLKDSIKKFNQNSHHKHTLYKICMNNLFGIRVSLLGQVIFQLCTYRPNGQAGR